MKLVKFIIIGSALYAVFFSFLYLQKRFPSPPVDSVPLTILPSPTHSGRGATARISTSQDVSIESRNVFDSRAADSETIRSYHKTILNCNGAAIETDEHLAEKRAVVAETFDTRQVTTRTARNSWPEQYGPWTNLMHLQRLEKSIGLTVSMKEMFLYAIPIIYPSGLVTMHVEQSLVHTNCWPVPRHG